MDTKKILRRIDFIEKCKDNPKMAHALQDMLYEEFISGIANTKGSLGDRAKLVMSVKDIEFERWYS